MKTTQNTSKGFSLIELLIVLAVTGILITIAYTSYSNYLLKSRRIDAMMTLAQDQNLLEQCHAKTFSYKPCAVLPNFPHTSAMGYYTISLSNLGKNTYILTAKPRGSQTKDTNCSELSVNQANVKTAANAYLKTQNHCWNP